MEYPSHEAIRSLCTHQSYERGVNYHDQGRVRELTLDGAELTATVRGTHDYEISITIDDSVQTYFCSCPYDYAGACKHVVAVLLAANEREPAQTPSDDSLQAGSPDPIATDVQTLVEETPTADLRTFLQNLIADDHDIRDRFVAFAGDDTEHTVYDYKEEINRLFENALSRRGMIEYNTHIDFSHYHDLAATHRSRGHIQAATTIYRALAEAIRENMTRIDDSGGYYGRKLEEAIDAYAETIDEQNLDPDEKQAYIDELVTAFIEADYAFVRDDYDDALRTVCTTTSDLEHWFDRLNPHIAGVSIERTSSDDPATATAADTNRPHGETASEPNDDARTPREPPDGTLHASDFTAGPLTIEEFTGETLDVAHLTVGPLELQYFVGDAFENFHVDAPTTVEEHTADITPSESETSTSGSPSSLRTRRVLSSYLYLADQLGDEETVLSVYDDIYLDNARFCKQYAEQLIDRGNEERALRVVEDGLETFGSTTALQWLAADLYRERNTTAYRETLERLFLDHSEWDAYDELKASCDDERWDSIYEEIITAIADNDHRRLIDVYIHEGELEDAFAAVENSENLTWFQQYAQTVAQVDPDAYFEAYKELLVPFAAGETGRRHYREIVDHLEAMQAFASADRFDAFVEMLKDTHSNRPAFLDELDKAGF
ncbi:SWIM zinc finger family protein [Halococcus thailandensis]|nr:SWIM zinc finger family protein [Halococcus thailandensis]